MKFSIYLILLIVTSFSIVAQTKPVKQLAPDVYYYFGDELQGKSANCVWIAFKDYVLAIDANYPWGAEEIIGEIRKTTDKPISYVFNTHYHHDHTFGNCVFADSGAIIVSTIATAEEMKTVGQKEWDQNYSGRDMSKYRRVFPSFTFENWFILEDSVHRVELRKMGQAHTLGDAIAWLPKEKILITGDLCVNGNPWGNNVADPNVDYDKWLVVLDTLVSWDPAVVVPGHGEPGTVQTLKNQRAYLADMLKQVRNGIKKGKTKEQLVKEIDLSKHPVYGENKVSIERSIKAMYDHERQQLNR